MSHLNPFFYMIDGFRHGFFGTSDVSPWLSLALVATSLASSAALPAPAADRLQDPALSARRAPHAAAVRRTGVRRARFRLAWFRFVMRAA